MESTKKSASKFSGLELGTVLVSPHKLRYTVVGYAKTGTSVNVVVGENNMSAKALKKASRRTFRFSQLDPKKWHLLTEMPDIIDNEDDVVQDKERIVLPKALMEDDEEVESDDSWEDEDEDEEEDEDK